MAIDAIIKTHFNPFPSMGRGDPFARISGHGRATGDLTGGAITATFFISQRYPIRFYDFSCYMDVAGGTNLEVEIQENGFSAEIEKVQYYYDSAPIVYSVGSLGIARFSHNPPDTIFISDNQVLALVLRVENINGGTFRFGFHGMLWLPEEEVRSGIIKD